MQGIKEFTLDGLKEFFLSINEKPYRAEQVYKWLYKDRVESFGDMTNLSIELRDKLKDYFYIEKLEILEKQISEDGTIKYLFKLPTSDAIETVLMKYNHGYTICLSTQKGCKMGCKFCASTKAAFSGNLTAGEIIEQILMVEKTEDIRISNVVFMGIGEPLDNFDNLVIAIENINNHKGLEIGARHISISTCGVADKIRELADLKLQSTLSISLHATNDIDRSAIMPINNRFNLKELIDAVKYYTETTNRRVSFEYALIKDKNDNLEDAKELVNLIKGIHSHVNLIPINEVEETDYKKTTNEKILKYRDYLNEHGIVATIRRELGSDIDAACGQLRKRSI